MAATIWQLFLRALSLLGVLLVVLLILVIFLGATGYSDNFLRAQISEDLRGHRQSLAQTIRDPAELEEAIAVQREQLIISYGLDQAVVRPHAGHRRPRPPPRSGRSPLACRRLTARGRSAPSCASAFPAPSSC